MLQPLIFLISITTVLLGGCTVENIQNTSQPAVPNESNNDDGAEGAHITADIDKVLSAIPPAMDSPNIIATYADKAEMLSELRTKLLVVKENNALSQKDYDSLSAFLTSTVLPASNSIIEFNTEMSKMGHLNTKRTIRPSQAMAENLLVKSLVSKIQGLVSEISVEYVVSTQ